MLGLLVLSALAGPADDAARARFDATRAPVAIAVVEWSGPSIAAAGGAGEHTRFEVGSTSKLYTGLLLADAVVDGVVGLSDVIDPHLPRGSGFPDGPAPTFLELATHTAGLPKLPPNQTEDDRSARAGYPTTKLWASLPLTRRGERSYEYSNFSIGLLGETLGRAIGGGYPAALQQQVLAPLGLRETGLLQVPPGRDRKGRPADPWNFEGLQGAGSIDATPADQVTWLQAWLEPEATPLAASLRLAMAEHHRRDRDQSVGLAWRIREGEVTTWQHTGSTSGYSTYIGVVPSHGLGVVVMQAQLGTDEVAEVGKQLLDQLRAAARARAGTSVLRRIDALPGEAVCTVGGDLVRGAPLLHAEPVQGERARGLWLAVAARQAVAAGLLAEDDRVAGYTVADWTLRAWLEGAAPGSALEERLASVTGHKLRAAEGRRADQVSVPQLLRLGQAMGSPPPAYTTWESEQLRLVIEPASRVVCARRP